MELIESYDALRRGRQAADQILSRYLRQRIRKAAMRLDTPQRFDRAVAAMANVLRAQVGGTDDAAVREAVKVLDVDWHATTPEQRRRLVAESMKRAGRVLSSIPKKIEATLGEAATDVVNATRHEARRKQNLAIGADFNALDKRIVHHLQSSEGNYVTDAYRQRQDEFSAKAREIVARGLESGLGRADLMRDLETAASGIIKGRNEFYWEVVAASFISRGRSFAQLSSYAEAGVDRYIIEAVQDERTTEICRFLHGKTFSVDRGIQTFERVEANPTDIKTLTPWVRERYDDKGRQTLVVDRGTGRTRRLAVVDKPGFGQKDVRGTYSSGLNPARLQELGVSFPPYHGLCRTSTLADVSGTTVTPRVARAVPKPKKVTDGPAQLLAKSTTFDSTSGQSLPLDAGIIENFDVQFRLESVGERTTTKVRFKVTDHHASSIRDAILKGDNANADDRYVHLQAINSTSRTRTSRRIAKTKAKSSLEFRAVSGSFGGARVQMVTEKGALTNFVEIDIATEDPRKAFAAYGKLARKLGIDEAANFPSATSVDMLRKTRLITQYDRSGWEKLRNAKKLSPELVDAAFLESAMRYPEMKAILDDSKLTQTARGHVSLYSKKQASRLKKEGALGLTHALSSPDSLIPILADPDGSGLLSSTRRYERGVFVNGMSTSTDFRTGGADGVFTRLVTKKGERMRGSAATIFIDADQLGRSDWYAFNFDNYGRAGPEQYGDRKLVPELGNLGKSLSAVNEVIFQHGIPIEAMQGVSVSDPRTRKRIIDNLREAGVTKINGKKVETFISAQDVF